MLNVRDQRLFTTWGVREQHSGMTSMDVHPELADRAVAVFRQWPGRQVVNKSFRFAQLFLSEQIAQR